MTRINLTGAWYSSRNAGDQAILVTIRALLESRIPDLRIQVICARDDFVRTEHPGLDAVSQTKHLGKTLLSVARSDALLLGGGTPFYNEFKHMCFFWGLSLVCKLTGGKLVVYGASAQQLHKPSARWFTRRIMNMADLITVREPVTKRQLERLGVRSAIHCTADPAITLTPCAPARVDEIFRAEGLDEGEGPVFAICPHFFSNIDPYRVHHYEKFADHHLERQQNVLAAAADHLTQHGRVVFLPMNTDPPDSDVDVQRDIQRRLEKPERVTVIETQYRPREIAGILARCKLVIGVRLHSLILAAAVHTPVIAINYAPKVEGFMALIDETEHSLPLQQLEFPALRQMIENYLAHYEGKRHVFVEHVTRAQERATENADMVARLLRP